MCCPNHDACHRRSAAPATARPALPEPQPQRCPSRRPRLHCPRRRRRSASPAAAPACAAPAVQDASPTAQATAAGAPGCAAPAAHNDAPACTAPAAHDASPSHASHRLRPCRHAQATTTAPAANDDSPAAHDANPAPAARRRTPSAHAAPPDERSPVRRQFLQIYQAEIPMSSSSRVPFQDITNRQIKDPRELKRQRDKERYAKNKDEILKRRHQLRELKKQSTAPVNDENTLHDTDDIGESILTNIQFRATEEGHVF